MRASMAKTTIAAVFAGTAKAAIKHHYYHPHQTKIQYNLIIIMDLHFTFKSRCQPFNVSHWHTTTSTTNIRIQIYALTASFTHLSAKTPAAADPVTMPAKCAVPTNDNKY